jgi:hypothetical protein
MKKLVFVIVFVAGGGILSGMAQRLKAPARTPKPEIFWRHAYHQTLTLKLFLAEAGAVKGEGAQRKRRDTGDCDVLLNFEQALEVIRKVDNLTAGIPKIVYLVGWQYNGHDSRYPAWDEVNPRLKRPQDKTALESMKWLMEEAFRYHTTVSVHLNMFDAYEDSPLWETYVEQDIIARHADGSLRKGEWGWPISYTQEWKTGYAQRRIDRICEMLPLEKAGTVHIDAFHSWVPLEPEGPISPYLGYTAEEETETQRKIFRYWSAKGVDVTSEGMRFLRLTAFEGLQPAAWHFSPSAEEYLSWPASYYCGGTTNDPLGRLFGKSMHGEALIREDPVRLSGFLEQFCLQTLPWYFLNRLERLAYSEGKSGREATFSGGVTSRLDDREYSIRQGDRLLLRNGDAFIPALWLDDRAVMAYSRDGYGEREWEFPAEWDDVPAVDIFRLTPDGLAPKQEGATVQNRRLSLALERDEAVLIRPSGAYPVFGKQDTVSVASFGLKPGTRENAVPYVQKALEACREFARPVLLFPQGRYDFWPQHCVERDYFESNTTDVNPKRLAVLIDGMEGLTVDGSGSEFVFHDRMQPFTIDDSRHIVVKNVSVDWDIPLSAQAVVGNVTDQYADLQINAFESPYVVENGKLTFVGEGWKSEWWGSMEFGRDDRRVVAQSGDQAFGEGWDNYRAEELAKGLVRLHYPFKRTPAPGNWLVLRHSRRDHAGIFITGSDHVRLERIQIYHTAGLGVLAQYSSDLCYERVDCVPNERKGRILAGHDDGFHYSNCNGQIRINHCRFHALMDDPANVHGTGLKLVEKRSAATVRCRFMHSQSRGLPWAGKGETVGFIHAADMRTVARGTVKSFRAIDVETVEIEFEQAIPAEIQTGDALENLTRTPDVDIRNSFFGSCRARGLLISTPGKVVVENNIFESSGSPILIAGDANYWYETGATTDVLIRNNTFRAPCLTSMYQFCQAVVSICPEIPEVNPSAPYHRNITITDNDFHLFDYPALYALSVANISFTNNRLTRSRAYPPWHPVKAGLTFEACKKITVRNNRLEGDVPGTTIALPKTPPRELTLDKRSAFKK